MEVDASKDLVTSVEIKLPTGVIYEQSVVFEYTPKYCKKCKSFGHDEGDCNKELAGRKYSVYVPKRVAQPRGEGINKNEQTGGNKRGAKAPSGKSKLGEDSAVNSAGLTGESGQTVLSAPKGIEKETRPDRGVVHDGNLDIVAPAIGDVLRGSNAGCSGDVPTGCSRPGQGDTPAVLLAKKICSGSRTSWLCAWDGVSCASS